MEDQRCSLSLSVLILAVMLGSGTAGKSHAACKLLHPVPVKRLFGLPRRCYARYARLRSDAQQVTHLT